MQWVNPPVAMMLNAGIPQLLDAGRHLPGLCEGDLTRVALQGDVGLVARAVIGGRSSKPRVRDHFEASTRRLSR